MECWCTVFTHLEWYHFINTRLLRRTWKSSVFGAPHIMTTWWLTVPSIANIKFVISSLFHLYLMKLLKFKRQQMRFLLQVCWKMNCLHDVRNVPHWVRHSPQLLLEINRPRLRSPGSFIKGKNKNKKPRKCTTFVEKKMAVNYCPLIQL